MARREAVPSKNNTIRSHLEVMRQGVLESPCFHSLCARVSQAFEHIRRPLIDVIESFLITIRSLAREGQQLELVKQIALGQAELHKS